MRSINTLFCLTVLFFFPFLCNAGNDNEKAGKRDHAEMNKKMLDREAQKAKHMQEQYGNTERLERKHGRIKDTHKDQYNAVLSARQAAFKAWDEVAKKAATAQSPDELSDLKTAAYNATSAVYLAEIELKSKVNATERSKMVEKVGDKTFEDAVKKLDEAEQQLLEAQRARVEAEKNIRLLEMKTRMLSKQLRQEYEKARAAKKEAHKAEKKEDKKEGKKEE